MISIKAFFPLNGLARVTWEFHDDRVIMRRRSITVDAEHETRYEKVRFIRQTKHINLDWLGIELLLIVLAALLGGLWDCFFTIPLPTHILAKPLFIIALAFLIPALHKERWCSLLDVDRNFLVSIRIDRKNQTAFDEALKIVRQKANLITEASVDAPLPGAPPLYEITEFDFPDFLNKSTTRFYDDRMIDIEKSLTEEVTTEIHYSELSGKTQVVRFGNEKWGSFSGAWLCLVSTITIFSFLFLPRHIYANPVYVRFETGGFLLLIPMLFLNFIKGQILLFYNKNDRVIYGTRPNSADRKTLEEVIKFIQGKVASNDT